MTLSIKTTEDEHLSMYLSHVMYIVNYRIFYMLQICSVVLALWMQILFQYPKAWILANNTSYIISSLQSHLYKTISRIFIRMPLVYTVNTYAASG